MYNKAYGIKVIDRDGVLNYLDKDSRGYNLLYTTDKKDAWVTRRRSHAEQVMILADEMNRDIETGMVSLVVLEIPAIQERITP